MRLLMSGLAAVAMLAAQLVAPARAEIARSEPALAGRTICWWSGWDSEQFNHDHTYVYSYHQQFWYAHQVVVHGVWSIAHDGTVTLAMEGGGTLTRKYDINGDRVVELTGTLHGGSEGYFCSGAS